MGKVIPIHKPKRLAEDAPPIVAATKRSEKWFGNTSLFLVGFCSVLILDWLWR